MSISRSRQYDVNYLHAWGYRVAVGSVPSFQLSYTPGWGDTVTYDIMPNWRNVVKLGMNATTFLSGSRIVAAVKVPHFGLGFFINKSVLDGTVGLVWDYDWRNSFQDTLFPIFDETSDLPLARARATQQLIGSLYNAHHQLQGGVVLGELNKTVKQLVGTASALRKGIIQYLVKAVGIRRGRGSRDTRLARIRNTYLEYTFGWQPLVGDCKDLAKTLGRLCFESDRTRFKVKGTASRNISTGSGIVGASDLVFDISSRAINTSDVYFQGFLRGPRYESGNPPLQRIFSMSGFDLASFVPNLWELIPYSWAIDYFTNIGSCLYQLSIDKDLVSGIWTDEIVELKYEEFRYFDSAKSESAIFNNFRNVIFVTGTAGHGMRVKRTVTRKTLQGVPILLPRVRLDEVGFRQFLNFGSVISGLVKR